ncbi:MAG TPA: YdeI/OmpD-associated family protein [Gaiellaceae bacterium]|jgi:uncharacterized protein YdeI (YjbR/CyaY-like superfamily)
MDPTFFETPADLRTWLERHHADADELLVGFHKKGSGRASVTWPESVDEALCFGWIDGIRRSLDGERYTIRFTPRRPRSIWSAANIKRAKELTEEGRMQAAGLAAFERRRDDRSAIYSYEQRRTATLGAAAEERFRADAQAWDFFQAQPPGYRRTAIHWVTSAKREETRQRRLETLIDDSAHGRRLKVLTPPGKR